MVVERRRSRDHQGWCRRWRGVGLCAISAGRYDRVGRQVSAYAGGSYQGSRILRSAEAVAIMEAL